MSPAAAPAASARPDHPAMDPESEPIAADPVPETEAEEPRWRTKQPTVSLPATRELVDEFYRMPSALDDRQLKEARVEAHRLALVKGELRDLTWTKCYCRETGITYRINGKHTSTMLHRRKRLPAYLNITIEYYECDTREDVAALYATYDSRVQTRTVRDINSQYKAALPELDGVDKRTVDAVIAGVAYAEHFDNYVTLPIVDRPKALKDNVDFTLWIEAILSCGGDRQRERDARQKLARRPVVAALYATYLLDPDAAREFWEAVRDESGQHQATPDRRLAKFLLTTNVTSGTTRSSHRRSDGQGTGIAREFYAKCVQAWNAWRSGATNIGMLTYYSDRKLPVPV